MLAWTISWEQEEKSMKSYSFVLVLDYLEREKY